MSSNVAFKKWLYKKAGINKDLNISSWKVMIPSISVLMMAFFNINKEYDFTLTVNSKGIKVNNLVSNEYTKFFFLKDYYHNASIALEAALNHVHKTRYKK